MAQGGGGCHLDDSVDEFDAGGVVRQVEQVLQRVVGTLLPHRVRTPGAR